MRLMYLIRIFWWVGSKFAPWITIQTVDIPIKWVSLLSRRHSGAIFSILRVIQIFPWWPLRDIPWVYRNFYQCNWSNSSWNFNRISYVHIYIYLSTDDYSVEPSDPVNSSESFVTENPYHSLLTNSKSTASPSNIWILILLPLLSSFIILIPSGHNWIQYPRYPAPTLIIPFITTNHAHPISDNLSDLQQHLILPKSTLPEGAISYHTSISR